MEKLNLIAGIYMVVAIGVAVKCIYELGFSEGWEDRMGEKMDNSNVSTQFMSVKAMRTVSILVTILLLPILPIAEIFGKLKK